MTGIYRLANQTIQIQSCCSDVHVLCREYPGSHAPDFSVVTTQTDIDFEREKSAREDEIEGIPIRQFSDGYLETLAVYRKIAEKMPEYDTILFHGSCVAVDGAGYLFTAKSGTGKSTHTRLWRELLEDRAVMVNDDKPLIRIGIGGAVAYGTPWNGKHRLSANTAVPLKAVCQLERSADNHIEEVSYPEIFPVLFRQTYRPTDAAGMKETLALLDRLGTVGGGEGWPRWRRRAPARG